VALVFVKPHANSEKVREFVSGRLTSAGLEILAEGDISAEKIDADKMIDQHYAGIARGAMETAPSDIPISDDKKDEFSKTFGANWDEVSLIVSWTSLSLLPLDLKFTASTKTAKLING